MKRFFVLLALIAATAYGSDINGPLRRAQLEQLAADPTGSEARLYWNTVSKLAKYYDGTAWREFIGSTATQTLTNKTLTAPIISTISNTGTLTLPTSTDTLVGRATTDTLTNKTLTAPVISNFVELTSISTPATPGAGKVRFYDDTDVIKYVNSSGTVSSLITTATAVDLNSVQTLTNKTLTAPIISTISNTGTLTLPTSTDTLVGRATTDTLTNKTLTAPIISTISNTGTLTLPTSTDTLVGRATADTLTNKTLTNAVVSGTLDLPNGSLATPSIEFLSDADGSGTGIYRSGANALSFVANGVAAGTISSVGTYTLGIAASSLTHTIQSSDVNPLAITTGAANAYVSLADEAGQNRHYFNKITLNPANGFEDVFTVATRQSGVAYVSTCDASNGSGIPYLAVVYWSYSNDTRTSTVEEKIGAANAETQFDASDHLEVDSGAGMDDWCVEVFVSGRTSANAAITWLL